MVLCLLYNPVPARDERSRSMHHVYFAPVESVSKRIDCVLKAEVGFSDQYIAIQSRLLKAPV